MNGEGIVEVLKEILEQTKGTNARLESVDARLVSVETEAKASNARLENVEGEAKASNARLRNIEREVKASNARLGNIETEAKASNARLGNIEGEAQGISARLETLDGRVDFLEKRTTRGFESLNERLESHVDRLEVIARHQAESEMRLSTEVVSLAGLTREVRDAVSRRLDDHEMLLRHEERITTIESQLGHSPGE